MIANLTQLLCSAVLATTLASEEGASTNAERDDPTQRYTLFGLVDVCIGGPVGASECDVLLPELPRPPAQPPAPEPSATDDKLQPAQFTLFGKRLCIGEVGADVKCDWRLTPPQSA